MTSKEILMIGDDDNDVCSNEWTWYRKYDVVVRNAILLRYLWPNCLGSIYR